MKLYRKFTPEDDLFRLTFEISSEDLMLANMRGVWNAIWTKSAQRRIDYIALLEQLIRHPSQGPAGRGGAYTDNVAEAWARKFKQSGSSFFTNADPPPKPDPFWCKILGLPATATKQEIKARYRDLAKQHHPDKPGGDARKFDEITKAYEEALK